MSCRCRPQCVVPRSNWRYELLGALWSLLDQSILGHFQLMQVSQSGTGCVVWGVNDHTMITRHIYPSINCTEEWRILWKCQLISVWEIEDLQHFIIRLQIHWQIMSPNIGLPVCEGDNPNINCANSCLQLGQIKSLSGSKNKNTYS